MEKVNVKIKKLSEDAKTPIYATKDSAACDFYSIEDIIIAPHETKKIRTGIALEIPSNYFLKIEGRSGLSSKGIMKAGGVIDSDYRGEINIILCNTTKEDFKVEKGDRVAQGVFISVAQPTFEESQDLSETERGAGGFESTGRK